MRNGKVRAIAALGLAAMMGMAYLGYTSNSAHAQDAQTAGAKSGDKPGDNKGMGGMQMSPEDQKKMAEMYMKAAQPGPEHKKLAEMAGDWDANVTMYEGPQPTKSKGTAHCETIMGGRYLLMKFEGNMQMPGAGSMPFHGMAISGYDNGKKMYVNTWIDDMGTGIMVTEGKYDGDKLTCEGSTTDPMSGQPMKIKEISTHPDKDHMHFEMYGPNPTNPSEMMKMMEIDYTRKA